MYKVCFKCGKYWDETSDYEEDCSHFKYQYGHEWKIPDTVTRVDGVRNVPDEIFP